MNSLDPSLLRNFLVVNYDRYCAGSFDNDIFNQITADDVELEYQTEGITTYARGREEVSRLILEKHAYNVRVLSRKGCLYSSFMNGHIVNLILEIKEKLKPGSATSAYKLIEESTFEFVSKDVYEGERFRIRKVFTRFSKVPVSPCKQPQASGFSKNSKGESSHEFSRL